MTMPETLVLLDRYEGPQGSSLYSIRRDPNAPMGTYGEEEFWQLMLSCFSGTTSNARKNIIDLLAAKGSITDYYVLTLNGAAKLGWV